MTNAIWQVTADEGWAKWQVRQLRKSRRRSRRRSTTFTTTTTTTTHEITLQAVLAMCRAALLSITILSGSSFSPTIKPALTATSAVAVAVAVAVAGAVLLQLVDSYRA
jgi:hypothetical protein